MQYTKRDLRAADILAMIFLGLGLILVVLGIANLTTKQSSQVSPSTVTSQNVEAKSKAMIKAKHTTNAAGPLIAGLVCAGLGTALGLKVQQLKKTGGKEPDEFQGVPES